MKQYRVAILGASGAVGQEMMKILAERKFPVGELHLLASARSAGKVVSWQGQNIALEEATDAAFAGMDTAAQPPPIPPAANCMPWVRMPSSSCR